jgi:hypothetical protein
MLQVVPFQASAKGTYENVLACDACPTAVQALPELQDTPNSWESSEGEGMVSALHEVPFHRCADGTSDSELLS